MSSRSVASSASRPRRYASKKWTRDSHCLAHQVENVGDKEGKAIFVEAFPNCKPCGDIEGYISPFAVSPGLPHDSQRTYTATSYK